MTGSVGLPCCAQTGSDPNKIKMPGATSPPRRVVNLIADRLVALKPKNFIRLGDCMNSKYHKPVPKSGLQSMSGTTGHALPIDPSSHCAFLRDFVNECH